MPATHHVANQSSPLVDYNLFTGDRALVEATQREGAGWAQDDLTALGKRWGSAEMLDIGRLANENLPKLRSFNRFGQRIDQVEFHPSYHQAMEELISAGCHSSPWSEQRPGAQVARAARVVMFGAVENGAQCPVTMTFAAIPILAEQPALARDWMPRLLSRSYDPRFLPITEKTGATIGMGMTEKQGGTDLRANTTRAKALGTQDWGEAYAITGHKWFMSAPMCDAFLVLAQIENEGLSCFFLPRILPDGQVNSIHIQRLKDKLGNKSNASSEVEFDEAVGFRIGDSGRGIPTIIEMANLSRIDCALGSSGILRAAVALALHHASERQVFGKTLADQPLMTAVLADLALESEAATALSLRLARALDDRKADPTAEALLRVTTPIAKYWICKRSMAGCGEAMEVLGGNGYTEEAPLARFYREAPVNSIWEGSGNVMCLDVIRALARGDACRTALLAELNAATGLETIYDAALHRLMPDINSLPGERDARRFTEDLGRLLQAACLLRGDRDVAKAFCLSRLDPAQRGQTFGILPTAIDTAALVARATPHSGA